MSDYNESESMNGTTLEAEYDAIFDGAEKAQNMLKITSDKFTRSRDVIKIKEIGFSEPIKRGRQKTMIGLTQSVKELGVVTPIHVMKVAEEDEDDEYKYVLIDGLRRVFGAMKNNIEEIDAIIWDFKDKDLGMELLLPLSLILNRTQKRSWGEIWDLYRILEMRSQVTPGTLEYLLQLNGGDAMKLKDVMLCDYSEVKEALLNDEKDLDGCYKMLQKLRKEEDQLGKDDATGFSDTVENAEELTSDNTEGEGQLSDQDVLELLEMVDDLDNLDDVSEEDFDSLNKAEEGYIEQQKVGERHPLDPALKSAVLSRDNFRCKCCGFGGAAALGILAVHHVLPAHVGGKDTLENLTTLCLNHHILLHVAERNGGKLQMTKEEFDSYSPEEQDALKKTLKLARIAVEANKRKGLSKEQVEEATRDAIRHPMPGAGLPDNRRAYEEAKLAKRVNEMREEKSTSDDESDEYENSEYDTYDESDAE